VVGIDDLVALLEVTVDVLDLVEDDLSSFSFFVYCGDRCLLSLIDGAHLRQLCR
jgi:hypothetical protein